MIIQTGSAILKKTEDGKSYWHTYDEFEKEGCDLEVGQEVEFNPFAFTEGTEIKIFENIEG
jgi:hypothetical protein